MGGRRRIVVASTVLGAVAVAALTAPAMAVDDGIPRTNLTVAGEKLRGGAWSTQESHATGPSLCVTGHGDGVPTVRRHERVNPGRREATVAFLRSDRPSEVEITVYRHLDRYRTPTGKWSDKEVALDPIERNGRTVGWSASFSLKVEGRRYVESFAEWPDEDGCGEDSATFIYPGIRPAD
jgi:hypothetical protein